MKTSELKNELLMHRLRADGVNASYSDAKILRLAASTLHAWFTRECNGEVERDDDGKCWTYPCRDRNDTRYPARDLETAAIDRIKAICNSLGAHYYIQGDPRGASLYVSAVPIHHNSNRGVCCDLD